MRKGKEKKKKKDKSEWILKKKTKKLRIKFVEGL